MVTPDVLVFNQAQPVCRKKLQLVGITALLLASKYEEMFSPNIEDFVYITDNAYTSSQIREMETLILKELKFELGRPLPLHFLRRASKAGEVSATVSGKVGLCSVSPQHIQEKAPVDQLLVGGERAECRRSVCCSPLGRRGTAHVSQVPDGADAHRLRHGALPPFSGRSCRLLPGSEGAGPGKMGEFKGEEGCIWSLCAVNSGA